MEATDEDKAAPGGLWGWSPESRRYVLRSGSTWARLVKRGTVQDPDLEAQWTASREAARQRQIAAAADARVLGLGLAGGVSRSATSRERFRAGLSEDFRASIAPTTAAGVSLSVGKSSGEQRGAQKIQAHDRADMRSRLVRLALENKEALIRSDMTRDEAEQLLRRALQKDTSGQAKGVA
jgi:hypothetical protein